MKLVLMNVLQYTMETHEKHDQNTKGIKLGMAISP